MSISLKEIKNKEYQSLKKAVRKSNRDWEDDLHNFVIYNFDKVYSSMEEVIKDLRKWTPDRSELRYYPTTRFQSLPFLLSEVEPEDKLLPFIDKLTNSQMPFVYKTILKFYLTINEPFKEIAKKLDLKETTFRYKLQKAFRLLFLYRYNYLLNIKNLKIMSVQKLKPGFERLAYLIERSEQGYPFIASEFLQLYKQATGEVDVKFEYRASVVKNLIARVKEVIYEREEPLEELNISTWKADSIEENEEVNQVDSFKPEAELDMTLKSNKQRSRRKNGNTQPEQ